MQSTAILTSAFVVGIGDLPVLYLLFCDILGTLQSQQPDALPPRQLVTPDRKLQVAARPQSLVPSLVQTVTPVTLPARMLPHSRGAWLHPLVALGTNRLHQRRPREHCASEGFSPRASEDPDDEARRKLGRANPPPDLTPTLTLCLSGNLRKNPNLKTEVDSMTLITVRSPWRMVCSVASKGGTLGTGKPGNSRPAL